MKTFNDDGKPYDLEGLIDGFALRIANVAEMSAILAKGKGNRLASLIEQAVCDLNGDWDCFEAAYRQLPEDPEVTR